jgi:hypothetical protein
MPSAARVVQADDGRAVLQREVHHVADLLRVLFGERAAEDREVLREHEDEPSVDAPVARDHAVARHDPIGHAEVGGAVLHEDAGFLERAGIEEKLDPFARGEAPLGVELRDPLLAAAGQDSLLAASQLFDRRGSCQSVAPVGGRC